MDDLVDTKTAAERPIIASLGERDCYTAISPDGWLIPWMVGRGMEHVIRTLTEKYPDKSWQQLHTEGWRLRAVKVIPA